MKAISFAGVEFKNPFVVASGPLTASVDLLRLAEEHGAAGASIKLTMARPPFPGQLRAFIVPEGGMIHASERRLSLSEGLDLLRQAKETTSLRLFANITSETGSLEEWVHLAVEFAKAGADLIEANLCCPMIGLDQAQRQLAVEGLRGGAVTGEDPELVYRIAKAISSEVDIPLVCKLTPTVPRLIEVGQAAAEGGARGLAVFGGPSLALPPVDLESGKPLYPLLEGACYGFLAGPVIKYASFKRVAELKSAVDLPIIGSGGISNWRDAAEMMMWGADLVSACASIMLKGFQVIQEIVDGLESYIQRRGLNGYKALVGTALEYLRPSHQVEVVPGYAVVDEKLCVGCGQCEKIGHCSAITLIDGVAHVVKEKCIGCGICESVCPKGAIHLKRL